MNDIEKGTVWEHHSDPELNICVVSVNTRLKLVFVTGSTIGVLTFDELQKFYNKIKDFE